MPTIESRRATGMRWMRILAIAASAVILASCRSLTSPVALSVAAISQAAAPVETVAEQIPGEGRDERGSGLPHRDEGVRKAGLESPCPPLPRLRRPGCRTGGCGPAAACAPGPCAAPACVSAVCMPPAVVPVVGPCLVCDGGDAGAPARPAGRDGIRNLTAGDTVARYRPAGVPVAEDDAEEACLAVSNRACVYAPRFASVREIIRPHEDASPVGPKGIAQDALAEAAIDTLPVLGRTQRLAPEGARNVQPLLAVEERLPPLAVDQNDLPEEAVERQKPAAEVRDEQPRLTRLVQRPRIKVGFDVPFAWTCVTGAQVTVNGQNAEVIAADRGTATLRLEEPGRCELTLCKRAGSDTARVDEELDFTIFLLNSGDRPLEDIVLVDAVPKRLEFIQGSAASNLPADISTETGDDGSLVLKWRLRDVLPPGEGGFVRFRTIVR